MSLSQVGVPGQQVDVLHGGDVDPSGRLLSVGEIQQAFRELRQSRPRGRMAAAALHPDEPAPDGPTMGDTAASPSAPGGDTRPAAAGGSVDTARDAQTKSADAATTPDAAANGAGRLRGDWIAVVAAHAGAGASTVALAITDALSAGGRNVHLVESAHPSRSGLIAAASAELGTDPTGAWRRGSRQLATVFRRAGESIPHGWPEAAAGADPPVTVLDLGLPAPENLTRLADDQPNIVVVCRPTIPGVRLAEQLLAQLGAARVVVAALGSKRWPGEVVVSVGPALRALRDGGQVVPVPEDRHLQVTGPTHLPLPKPVTAAGRALLGLIDVTRPGYATTPAQPPPRRKGTTR
jgi:hypothetical protein